MNFTVTCKAIKEFDATTGKYVHCNQVVDVTTAQIGTLVPCPECENSIEVHNPSMLGAASQPQAASDRSLPAFDPNQPTDLPEEVKPETSGSSSAEEKVLEIDASDLRNVAAVQNLLPNPPGNRATEPPSDLPVQVSQESHANANPDLGSFVTDLPTEVSDAELKKDSLHNVQPQTLTPSTFSRDNSCHKCGTLLAEKQAACPNCQAPRRAAFVDKEHRKAFSRKGPFGFQLWMTSMTNSGSKKSEVNYFAIMCYVVSVLMMGSGIAFMIFAGITGIFVGALVGFGGFCLFAGTRFWGQTQQNPRTPIPLIGRIAWSVVLYFLRNSKFKKFKSSAVLDKFGEEEPFGDRELSTDPNLNKYKVIDLEGTQISDAALLYLYDLRGIQYLVVRNTNVTVDAVHDLHQTIPKTWIWY